MLDFQGTLRAAQQGDDAAFARLWRDYEPGLLRYLTVRSASDAEDLAADIWLNLVRALPTFQGNEHGFRSWLFTTARNRLTDWYHGSDRWPEVVQTDQLLGIVSAGSVEGEVTERSATDAAIALVATLPPDQSEAVLLWVIVGLDVSHVAELMGRTPGSVRVLCHRGLKHLERTLGDGGPERAAVGAQPIARDVPVEHLAPMTPVPAGPSGRSVPELGRRRLHA